MNYLKYETERGLFHTCIMRKQLHTSQCLHTCYMCTLASVRATEHQEGLTLFLPHLWLMLPRTKDSFLFRTASHYCARQKPPRSHMLPSSSLLQPGCPVRGNNHTESKTSPDSGSRLPPAGTPGHSTKGCPCHLLRYSGFST